MKKEIILTLEFNSDEIFADNHLFDAALFLNGIDFGFVFDCTCSKIDVRGLPSEFSSLLCSKVSKREVIINE